MLEARKVSFPSPNIEVKVVLPNDHFMRRTNGHSKRRAGRPSRGALVRYLAFDRAAGISFYQQIHDGVRAAILEGRLRPSQRLPSTRALARDLGISRLPVLNAFEQLLHEGYVVGRVGSGT